MNINQLTVLDALVNSDSLQQAANILHKSQPALSMAIKKLEQQCGFTIVERGQYRLSLTPAGQRFYQQAQLVLQQNSQLKSLAKHLSQGAEASLRLSFDEAVDLTLLLPALAQVQQQYPLTELSLSYDYRLQSLEKLKQQQTDLAISPWYPVFIGLGQFSSVAIGQFELVCLCSPQLLPAAQPTLLELQQLPQLIADSVALDFDSGKLVPMQSALRIKVSNGLMMKQALLSGLGWGMMPRYQVAAELAAGQLQQITLPGFPEKLHGEVHLVKHRDQLLGPVAALLWQHWSQLP